MVYLFNTNVIFHFDLDLISEKKKKTVRLRVQAIRHALIQCKSVLQCKRGTIRSLYIETLEYGEAVV